MPRLHEEPGSCDGGLQGGGPKAPAPQKRSESKKRTSEGGRYKGKRGHPSVVRASTDGGRCAGLAGDLLELELAIEGLEDPGLEGVAVAGLYFAEDEA